MAPKQKTTSGQVWLQRKLSWNTHWNSETKYHVYSLSSWTLRNNHGCRLDPKPTAENLLLRNQRWLQRALLGTANKHTTHPLAVATRLRTTELKNSTSITFHWVKGHVSLRDNERADYLAKIAASYNTTIVYDVITINRGKQILEEYYIKILNATYINSVNASHTKLFIPIIFHRLSLPLWTNFILTQFLTNHGSFRS